MHYCRFGLLSLKVKTENLETVPVKALSSVKDLRVFAGYLY